MLFTSDGDGTDAAIPPAMAHLGALGNAVGESGHTLLELVTVVAIVAVASALAYPSLAGMCRGQQLEEAAVGTAQVLRLAHWRAIASGWRVQVAPRRGADGTWVLGTEREAGGSWVPDGEERRIPRGVLFAVAGPETKVFNPDGTCSFGSYTLRGEGGAVYRCTLAPATGRVRLYRGDREVGRGN
ncbi:MAG TPA: prepilin-type N-terminal cleavage/methylation domain-containing protein [Candidatus Methanoperedens sp.]|nr:prepilin-type N-terminal cleavage/methylation domain-containing protein [Candidatus Methanoperedens sp.]